MKTNKFFYITLDEDLSKGKSTKVWNVFSTDDSFLGRIGWYPAWRRYTFAPTTNTQTIYDFKCLRELALICRRKTFERQAERKLEKENVNG